MIAAVLGAENQSGDFEVVDMCFAGMPPQPSSSTSKSSKAKSKAAVQEEDKEGDPYVALISGLELGTNEQASDYRVGLLAEWLLGEVGSEEVSLSTDTCGMSMYRESRSERVIASFFRPGTETSITGRARDFGW